MIFSINPRARKATLLVVAMLTIMSGATIAPSLPGIEASFTAEQHAALMSRLILTLPALFVALSAPVAGALADRYGRRPILIGSILLYAVAGASGLILDTITGLLAGRALLGVAVAGVMTTATALAGDYFAGAERDRYMGLQIAFTGIGGLLFLTGGGFLADIHWRAPFAVYGFALLLAPAAALFLDEPARGGGNGGAAEARASSPWKLAVAGLFLVAAVNSIAFYLIPTQMPFHLRTIGVEAPSSAGLAIGLFNLASAICSLFYGRLRRRMSVPGIFAVGFALLGLGLGLISAAATYAAIVLCIALAGCGIGLVMPNLMAGAMAAAPAALRGRIAGGLTASIFIGQFASPFASQPWIASFGFEAAFRDAGLLLGLAAAASAAAALALTWGRSARRSDTATTSLPVDLSPATVKSRA